MSIRGGSRDVTVARLALHGAVLSAFSLFTSCVPEDCPPKDAPCMEVVVTSTLPFTFTYRGRTYSDSGGTTDFSYRLARLPEGRNELAGTASGPIGIWLIRVGTYNYGGPLLESFASVEGPGAEVRRVREYCQATYAPTAATPLPYSFRVRVDVVTSEVANSLLC